MNQVTRHTLTEFCTVDASSIFIECIQRGCTILGCKNYSISFINAVQKEALVDDRALLSYMKANPYFFDLNYDKYNVKYDEEVVSRILSKDIEWINSHYLDVLMSIFINRKTVFFELVLLDEEDTESICLCFDADSVDTNFLSYSKNLYSEITKQLIDKFNVDDAKNNFSKILGDDEYSKSVEYIPDTQLKMLYLLTSGEFIDKPYNKEFIKCFMSLVSLRSPYLKSYSKYGVSCEMLTNKWEYTDFNYKDETLYFTADDTGELIGISFSHNEIKFILNDGLSENMERVFNSYLPDNFISQLYTSGKYKIWSTKVTRDEINPNFMWEALNELKKDNFLFITVKNGWKTKYNTGDVIFIDAYTEFDSYNDSIDGLSVKNIGDVIGVFNKRSYKRLDTLVTMQDEEDKKVETNSCPLAVDELIDLLENNYVAVDFVDGSSGWISSYADHRAITEIVDEIHVVANFDDRYRQDEDSFSWVSSYQIKEIIFTKTKNINNQKDLKC